MQYEVRLLNVSIPEENLADIARISTGRSSITTGEKKERDENKSLIKALFKSRHDSIFEFINLIFFVEAPCFVRDQLIRYRCASYNCRSLRRCEPIEIEEPLTDEEVFYQNIILPKYRELRDSGEKKEIARGVLPSCAPTNWVVNYNARELFHVFDQRITVHTQRETRTVVEAMFVEFEERCPILAECWKKAHEVQNTRATDIDQ